MLLKGTSFWVLIASKQTLWNGQAGGKCLQKSEYFLGDKKILYDIYNKKLISNIFLL